MCDPHISRAGLNVRGAYITVMKERSVTGDRRKEYTDK
jgi:hypothetical protein